MKLRAPVNQIYRSKLSSLELLVYRVMYIVPSPEVLSLDPEIRGLTGIVGYTRSYGNGVVSRTHTIAVSFVETIDRLTRWPYHTVLSTRETSRHLSIYYPLSSIIGGRCHQLHTNVQCSWNSYIV